MKVQSGGDIRSINSLQSAESSPDMNRHQPAGSISTEYQRVTPAQMKQLNEIRMQALKSEFDSMEESLRDALRQECRQQNTKIESKRLPVCDSTITKRHNYITVYEHDQRKPGGFRNNPNLTEQQRCHQVTSTTMVPSNVGQAQARNLGNISVEEFQQYCSLLTDRIQKMEEQNIELVKLAEQQKMEYEKVVSQVVESEKSQRLLLSECNSLRQQVQQLANNNRKLKEQHLLNPSQLSSSSAAEKGTRVDIANCLRDECKKPISSKEENPKEVLQQLHGHPVSMLERYKTFDIASIVELYAALQKETLTDVSSPTAVHEQNNFPAEQRTGSLNEHASKQFATVSHKGQENDKNVYEDPDYASPSSICAAPSCTRCITGANSDYKSDRCDSHLHQQPDSAISSEISDQRNRRSSETSSGSKDVHCFDNNSYVEVEIKSGKSLQNSQTSSVEDFQPNYFARQNKSCLQNDYTNVNAQLGKDCPSSLTLDEDTSGVFLPDVTRENKRQQQSIPTSVTISPALSSQKSLFLDTPKEKKKAGTPDSQTQEGKSQYKFQRAKSKKVAAKPTFNSGYHRFPTSSSNSSRLKKYSRSSSASELPPPPPPPPSESSEGSKHSVTRNSVSSPTLCELNSTKQSTGSSSKIQRNSMRQNELNKKSTSPRNNNDLDKLLERPLTESDETSEEETSVGGRRGSYSRACRKSQSLDHLCEQPMTEATNESNSYLSKENEKNDGVESLVSPCLQNHASAARHSPLVQNRIKYENRNLPSPTFVVQESACTTSSYEVVMPAKFAKASAHQHRTQLNKDSSIVDQNRIQEDESERTQTNEHKFSSSANTSSFRLPAYAEDVGLIVNKQRLRNRRFSEGSNGNKQKDKIFSEESRNQIKRYRNVACDPTVFKEMGNKSKLQVPSASQYTSTKTSGNFNKESVGQHPQQPRFPATNPHARADYFVRKADSDANRRTASHKNPKSTERATGIPSVESSQQSKLSQPPVSPESPKSSVVSAALALQNMAKDVAEEMNKGRAPKKEAKPANHWNSPVSEDKKKGSSRGQSKSFVSLMKAKFSRSTTSGKSSSTDKQTKALSSFPVTPASSLIDPRTLSLEPNLYPPQSKDNKKGSKPTAEQNSEAAIGRKLSQPFPNGYGEILHPLHSLPEEEVTESNTVELNKTDQIPAFFNSGGSNSSPKDIKRPSYENVDFLKENKTFAAPTGERFSTPTNEKQADNGYANTTIGQTRKVFQSKFENSVANSSYTPNYFDTPKLKQRRTRDRIDDRHQYENCLPKDASSAQNSTLQKQQISSEVHVARSCPQNKAIPSVAQPIKKSSIYGCGLPGRLTNSEIKKSIQASFQEKNNRDQASQKSEKEFINSMVKAELGHRNPKTSFPLKSDAAPDEPIRCALISSVSSIGESNTSESVGTMSSLGSFPSDPFESSNSIDAAEGSNNSNSNNNSASLGSLDAPTQNMRKNRLKQPSALPNTGRKPQVNSFIHNETSDSLKSKLASSKLKSTSSSPTSKEQFCNKLSKSAKERPVKNPDFHQHSYSRSHSEELQSATTSPLALTPKKSQIAYRTSKIAQVSSSRLPSAIKSADGRSSGIKTPEKVSPSKNSQFQSKISSATHLHFIPIPTVSSEKNRSAKKQYLCTQPT